MPLLPALRTALFCFLVHNHSSGYLRWVQDGTVIEIDSGALSKEMMVKLAKSM